MGGDIFSRRVSVRFQIGYKGGLNTSAASVIRSVIGAMASTMSFSDASASLPVSAKAVSKGACARLVRKFVASLTDLTVISAFQMDIVWSR